MLDDDDDTRGFPLIVDESGDDEEPSVTNRMAATVFAVLKYLGAGMRIVPVHYRSKKPIETGWPDQQITPEAVESIFGERDYNVGVVLGDASGGLVDVDSDVTEAADVTQTLLPDTLRFGRASRPSSHLLYFSPGCPTKKYSDPVDGKMLIESRGDRHFTVIPPSVHPSGEVVEWAGAINQPVEINPDELTAKVAKCAAAALLARHWGEGSRHELALALGAALLRAGWARSDVERFVRAVATAAHDEEVDDRVRCVEDSEEALSEGRPTTGWPTLATLLGNAVVAAVLKWLDVPSAPPGAQGSGSTQPEILLGLVSDAEPFHDVQGLPFVWLPVEGRRETHPLTGKGTLADHLLLRFVDAQGVPPKKDALEAAIGVLAARGTRGPEHPVALRVGWENGEIVIDPGWNDRCVIRVGPDGYRTAADTNIRFVRGRNFGALPVPEPGGSLEDLRPFVNVATDRDYRLLIMFLLVALRAGSTYPILILTGEPGAAKTTTSRYVKELCDPAKIAPLRSIPRTERDIAVAARLAHVPAFTNISKLSAQQSDTICRIATGEGFGTRQLYTDGEEFLFDGARPFVLNGIEDFVARTDLQDRGIMIELCQIDRERRRPLEELDANFAAAKPRIFGALLDALSAGVRNLSSVSTHDLPRMADVMRWVLACAAGTPWNAETLRCDYDAMQTESASMTVDGDNVGHALLYLARIAPNDEVFVGTATDLLSRIDTFTNEGVRSLRDWPKNGQRLSSIMRRLAPALRKAGITITHERRGKNGTKYIILTKTQ